MSALQERKYACRVSSTLNRDTKQFGKKFLFDNRDETCWNSDQGSPQWISLEFQDYTSISGFSLQFQGGFAGKECYVETEGSVKVLDFYPEDSNKIQYFYLKERVTVKKVRIAFNSSTDFFGRITIYRLDFYP
uniref:Nuclear receptor 2c2-associated protein n=1 Tax=Pseudodiaptomus poplesia TaxID=213370 RepID=A0A1S6GL84_9MAXI|nr:nuclear receptor 2c2-associated protein [Pseudodiaptomus poplesia]